MKRLQKLIALALALVSIVTVFVFPTSAASSSRVSNQVEDCLPIVTYASPLSGAKKVYAYSNSSLSKKQTSYYIDTYSDQIVITDISSNGKAVYVTYPTSSGKYRSKWFKTDDILGIKSVDIREYEAKQKLTVYRMSSSSKVKSNGSISKGDDCVNLGKHIVNNKNYYVTIYPISKTKVNGITVRHKIALATIAGYSDPYYDNTQIIDPNKNSTSNNGQAIRLDVPLLEQYHKDWKETYIGTKTIGEIGCLTTCISMVYSYEKNKTITPDVMKNKLDYSNNSLIWSSLDNVGLTSKIYNSKLANSMLSTIYNKLKAGKPVIIGATTSSGDYEHWVVITGYVGNSTSTFSTKDFLVNDPGSANSKTLQEFLANGNKTDRTYIKRIVY